MNAVLALDCATIACSAAVWRDGEVVARRLRPGRRGHAEVLMPMVQDVMAEADLAYDALDAIAATVGPGTFTGLRIGLAAARGLALAAGLPLVGVTTLEAIAHGVPESARAGRAVLVVLDARRGQVYAQAFGPDLAPRGQPAAVAPGVGAARVSNGDVEIRSLLIGMMFGVEVFKPLRELAQLYHQGMVASAAAKGIFNMLDSPIEIEDPEQTDAASAGHTGGLSPAPEISFEDVRFGHICGRGLALVQVSFTLI